MWLCGNYLQCYCPLRRMAIVSQDVVYSPDSLLVYQIYQALVDERQSRKSL